MTAKTEGQKNLILSHIAEHGQITSGEVAELLGVGTSRSKAILYQLTENGEIVAQGEDKNRRYVLVGKR